MQKQLFLHVGLAKTGTTAIQNFLMLNSSWLLERGISYQVTPGFNSHYDLQKEIRSGNYSKFEKNIKSQFDKTDTVLLSSEFFPGIIDKIKKNCFNLPDMKIIVYLRRQDYWLESLYAQEIKQIDLKGIGQNHKGISLTFREWLDKKLYSNSALKWKNFLTFCEKEFGFANLIVRIYEESNFFNCNLYKDFLNIFNLVKDSACQEPTHSNSNVSFPFELLELMRLSNCYYQGDLKKLFATLKKFNSVEKIAKIRIASNATRKIILNIFFEENLYIAKHFFNRNDGILFNMDLPNDNSLNGETIQQAGSTYFLMPTYIKLLKFINESSE
jgi:hypothetical protein